MRFSSVLLFLHRSSLVALAWGSLVSAGQAQDAASPGGVRPMYIREYRVRGVKSGVVGNAEIGEAVYPFLGPGQMPADVDRARAAVEKLYHDKGYQAVALGGEARINQNLKVKGGVGLSSGGNTVGMGASYQW